MEALQDSLEEDFGAFGNDIAQMGKKVVALKDEMKAVLGLVILVVIAVLIGGLIVAWQHFGFLCTPCTALCKCCCKGLSSCCKGGSSADDPEAQKSADLEGQKSAEPEAQKQPGIETKEVM